MDRTSVDSARDRILKAAGDLLAQGGREAVSTRTVSAAAGVQPQTIYRQFGDMAGLLGEAAHEGFRTYLASKSSRPRRSDPIDDLRDGWDLHIDFGLKNPALYLLMYGEPDSRRQLAASRETEAILRGLVEAVAKAGRLRTDIDAAAAMIHSTGIGVVITLISDDSTPGRTGLSQRVREAVIEAVVAVDGDESVQETPLRDAGRHAIALRSLMSSSSAKLTTGEGHLLDELLARIGKTDKT